MDPEEIFNIRISFTCDENERSIFCYVEIYCWLSRFVMVRCKTIISLLLLISRKDICVLWKRKKYRISSSSQNIFSSFHATYSIATFTRRKLNLFYVSFSLLNVYDLCYGKCNLTPVNNDNNKSLFDNKYCKVDVSKSNISCVSLLCGMWI